MNSAWMDRLMIEKADELAAELGFYFSGSGDLIGIKLSSEPASHNPIGSVESWAECIAWLRGFMRCRAQGVVSASPLHDQLMTALKSKEFYEADAASAWQQCEARRVENAALAEQVRGLTEQLRDAERLIK